MEFVQGDRTALSFEGKKDEIDKIEFATKNGVLKIKRKSGVTFGRNSKIIAYISAPYLEKIQLASGSDFNSDKMDFEKPLQISASSGSDFNVKTLNTSSTTIHVSGGADCEISNLTTQDLQLNASGGSDSKIHFENTGTVNANASGGSDLKLSGKVETINLNCSGGSDGNVKNLTYTNSSFNKSGGSDIWR